MKMICINCPKGCELDVEKSADGRTIQFCYSSGFVITYR